MAGRNYADMHMRRNHGEDFTSEHESRPRTSAFQSHYNDTIDYGRQRATAFQGGSAPNYFDRHHAAVDVFKEVF